MVKDYFKKIQRIRRFKNLRNITRGYNILRETNRLGLVQLVVMLVTNHKFLNISSTASSIIFGKNIHQAELITRQYLFAKFVNTKLNAAILKTIGNNSSFVFPIPAPWQRLLNQQGFRVSRLRCSLLWGWFVFSHWCKGILTILFYVYASILEIKGKNSLKMSGSAYFISLTEINLPNPNNKESSYDIFSWYARWAGRPDHVVILYHDIFNAKNSMTAGLKVIPTVQPILPISSMIGLFRFILWAFCSFTISAVNIVIGRWWNSLLLHEATLAAIVRHQLPDKLAQDYLFHNSSPIYRPLWTYEAEDKNSRILFYFYSVPSALEIIASVEKNIQFDSWNLMTWTNYLVWGDYQADFVRRYVGNNVNIQIVGPIWFSTSFNNLPELPKRTIAVFDIQPHRPIRYQVLGLPNEYYTPTMAIQFINDIHRVIMENNAFIAYKRKRNIGKVLHSEFARFIQKISHSENIINIEPDISAISVIKQCQAVISMPFTSTAFLGSHFRKPSIFYDPLCLLKKDDTRANGIRIIAGLDELRQWCHGIYRQN